MKFMRNPVEGNYLFHKASYTIIEDNLKIYEVLICDNKLVALSNVNFD